jgi:TRAP-type C4-dicarboxylate transport system permease small subunit
MRHIARLLDRATTVLAVVAGIAVVLLMIHVVIDVIARSGFGNTLPGTIAIVSNYYMVVIVCLPLAFVDRNDAHITVEALTNLFPARPRAALIGWTYPLSAVVFGLVASASWTEAAAQFRSGKFALEHGIAIPTWVGYFAVPLGYGMGALYVAMKFVLFLSGKPIKAVPQDLDHQVERLSHD